MQTPPFAGRVISAVDRLLNIAARFFADLPHLAGHVRGVFFFVADQDLADSKQDLCPARRGRTPPAIESRGRGGNSSADIVAD